MNEDEVRSDEVRSDEARGEEAGGAEEGTLQGQVERLRARAERERAARLEAETLAERSLRHLYAQQQELQLMLDVTAAANETATAEEALQVGLDSVCAHTAWPIGHVYLPDPADPDRLVPSDLWRLPEEEAFAAFHEVTMRTPFARGEGLPGRVLASGQPAWIRDVTQDEDFTRTKEMADLGVRGAFAFPVRTARRVEAVLEFFSVREEEPEEGLLEALAHLGLQLGLAVERHRTAAALAHRERQLREAQELARLGSWEWDVARDAVTWSDELYRIFGVEPQAFEPTFAGYLETIHPDDRDRARALIEEAFGGGGSFAFFHRVTWPDGAVRTVHSRGDVVQNEAGEAVRMQGTAQDVTEQKRAEDALQHYADDLERANAELEERNRELQQFAYVASHDLQEPLRMVASFLQLLERRYAGELDEKATEYIAFAVDGAQRMQRLIQDLLAFSRVGTRGEPFEAVDLGEVVATVLHDLGQQVEAAGAEVSVGALPVVEGDASQLGQVFQNLLANALKFRREEAPEVRIWAEEEGEHWRFAVADNGIGLEGRYGERVFQIFQRLHTRDAYEGTGIGLAIVKRIVERHGGEVWYESGGAVEEGGSGGTTFYFTLPRRPSNSSA